MIKKLHVRAKELITLYNALCNLVSICQGYRFHTSAVIVAKKKSISKKATIKNNVVIRACKYGVVKIAQNVWIDARVEIQAKNKISIGDETTINSGVKIIGNVSIGSMCLLAPNVFISSGSHNFKERPWLPIKLQDRSSPLSDRPILIDDDTWLGANVVVMPGVRIGKGCVIGANSVVTVDLPPYSIAVGMPAVVKGVRLDFRMPAEIQSSHDPDLPYFYSGFDFSLQGKSISSNVFGHKMSRKSVVCLNIGSGVSLLLLCVNKGPSAVNVMVGDQMRLLEPGENALRFDLDECLRSCNGYLDIVLAGSSLKVYLKAARVI